MGKRGGTRSTTFKPGQTIARKPKGPNAKTLLLENFAQTITEGGMERFQQELNKLSGKEYINAYLALFDFVKPKLSRVEVKDETPKDYRPQIIMFNKEGEVIDLRIDKTKGGEYWKDALKGIENA
jgi:hypothetical protein